MRRLATAGDPGAPLAQEHLTALEPVVGAGLKDVQVHTGQAAAQTARSLQADAFTIGRDIFFAQGKFDPASTRGRALLAHELTHVRQQTGPEGGKVLGYGGEVGEEEATAAEQSVLSGGQPGGGGLTVGKYVRNYASVDGGPLSPGERARLGAISLRALEVCRQLLGPDLEAVSGNSIDRLEVALSLDLASMGDEEAARVWGEVLADRIRVEAGLVGDVDEEGAYQPALAIQRWGPGTHKELTKQYVGTYQSLAPPGFRMDQDAFKTLIGNATDMDLRFPELWFNLRGKFKFSHGALVNLYQRNPARAQHHGEGGLYSIPKSEAVETNEATQGAYEAEARKAYQAGLGPFSSAGEAEKAREFARRVVLRALGDAFHVAQDRGSHGEGGIGEGHDRPFTVRGFKPDDPSINKPGLLSASRNSDLLSLGASDIIYKVLDLSWTRTLTYVQRAPAPGAPADPGPAEGRSTAAQQATQRAHERAGGNLARLDEMLNKWNVPEEDVISLLGRLPDAERRTVLAGGYKDRIARALNVGEMVRAVNNLKPELAVKLDWVKSAALNMRLIDYSEIKAMVTSAPQPQKDVLKTDPWRDFFVAVCTDKTMAEAVDDLGFDLATKLRWLIAEGLDYELLLPRVVAATEPQRTDALANRKLLNDLPPAQYWRTCFFLKYGSETKFYQGLSGLIVVLGRSKPSVDAIGAHIGGLPDAVAAKGGPLATEPLTQEMLRERLSGDDYTAVKRIIDLGIMGTKKLNEKYTQTLLVEPRSTTGKWEWRKQDYQGKAAYDVELRRDQVVVQMRINFVWQDKRKPAGLPAKPRSFKDAVATCLKSIQDTWDKRFSLKNADRTIPIRVEAVSSSRNPHQTVNLRPGTASLWASTGVVNDAGNWFVDDAPGDTLAGTARHEFGHLIGRGDEYHLSKAEYRKVVGTQPETGGKLVTGTTKDPDAKGGARYTVQTSVMGGLGGAEKGPASARHFSGVVAAANAARPPGSPGFTIVGAGGP